MTPRRTITAATFAVLVWLTTACGAQVEAADPMGQPVDVTITNCGKEVTYPAPQRAVAYTTSPARRRCSPSAWPTACAATS